MKKTKSLALAGQSVWIDDITRPMLTEGTLARYISEYGVTGLTSNPTIYSKAVAQGHHYDDIILAGARPGRTDEEIFYDLALRDLGEAADLFRDIYLRTDGVDGFVSLEVSPLLSDDAKASVYWATELHRRAARPNLFIKIPGTTAGLVAIEESIFAGIPVNVTLLFSAEQYRSAAEAYLRGIERRIDAGLSTDVPSVASLFVSRWDVAANPGLPPELKNRLGIAVSRKAYALSLELHSSARWRRAMNFGMRPQRLLFGSTSTKDPSASDTLYVSSLVAPYTVDTIPEKTLLAFADHGELGRQCDRDTGEADTILTRVRASGVDVNALAARLQREGTESFDKSWRELLASIQSRRNALGGQKVAV